VAETLSQYLSDPLRACLVPATSSGISKKNDYSERFLSNTYEIKWKNKIKK
jgi:hypothetical protein